MADVHPDTQAASEQIGAHRRTFQVFGKLVLFAVLMSALTLACLALAFLGNSPVIALLLGIVGTVAVIVVMAVR